MERNIRKKMIEISLYNLGYYFLTGFYGIFVIYCAVRGLLTGINICEKWWYERRVKYTIGNELLDPIFNLGVDIAHITFYIGTSTIMSAIIGASAPISIPIMALFSKKIPGQTPRNIRIVNSQ
jgi:hypothetical protein